MSLRRLAVLIPALLMVRRGWSFGTRPSMSTKASIISWGSPLPRIVPHLHCVRGVVLS